MGEKLKKFKLDALEVFQVIRKWKKKIKKQIKSINLNTI